MRKLLVVIVILLFQNTVYAISASSYAVVDMNSNRMLIGSNENNERLIASITKIMTAITVIENTNLDDIITVDEEVLSAYGSAIYIEIGEEISVRDLLYGLMLRSGNDAAVVLSNHVAGSMENFAKLMNDNVSKLGLTNTIFENSHGLDESGTKNYSTAYDMAIITSYAMKNEDFREISCTSTYTAKSSYKTYTWQNKNKLLSEDYITGGKTGYTEAALRTLVSTSSFEGIELVVVTLNDPNDFDDHKTLHEKIFSEYEAVKVIDKDYTSTYKDDLVYYVSNDYYALVKNGDANLVTVEYEYYKEPVGKAGGLIKVYLEDELLYEDTLFIKMKDESTENMSFWDKIITWIKSW